MRSHCYACEHPHGFAYHTDGTEEHPDLLPPLKEGAVGKQELPLDWLSQPSITITDTYTKEGRHLKRTMSLENGTVFDEEGPDPHKDVVFLRPGLQKMWKEHWKC